MSMTRYIPYVHDSIYMYIGNISSHGHRGKGIYICIYIYDIGNIYIFPIYIYIFPMSMTRDSHDSFTGLQCTYNTHLNRY